LHWSPAHKLTLERRAEGHSSGHTAFLDLHFLWVRQDEKVLATEEGLAVRSHVDGARNLQK
jgi:hypothetical protein